MWPLEFRFSQAITETYGLEGRAEACAAIECLLKKVGKLRGAADK